MGIFEVFYAPGRLFASLPERKAAWVLPYLLNIALVTAISILTIHYIGLENILRQQFEMFRMPPEQVDKAMVQALNAPAWRNYIGAVIGTAIFFPFVGGLMYVFALMANKEARYVDQFKLVCFAYFPYYVVTCLMSALILMVSPDPGSLDIRNLIATNVGAFLDKNTTSKGLYALAGSIDVLSFLEIFLLGYGFAKLNRVKVFFGVAAVMTLWILYVSVKISLSVLF